MGFELRQIRCMICNEVVLGEIKKVDTTTEEEWGRCTKVYVSGECYQQYLDQLQGQGG